MATVNYNVDGAAGVPNFHNAMRDLRAHNAPRYWTDMFLCAAVFGL